MAIMTGVQSAQVLGSTTKKQADQSRAQIEGNAAEFDASANVGSDTAAWESDGGQEKVERNNGLDVIR